MELKDTIKLMKSKDYKDRFKAEYYQTLIRFNKLKNLLDKWDKGTLDFKPPCAREFYDIQINAMSEYILVLESRAFIENIKLQINLLT